MSPDASLIGVVFAFILFVIFFSAVILYLAFRIKETFRKEQKRSFLVIKIVFLVGILFLAGGIFYFLANTLRTPTSTTPTTPTPTPSLNLTVTYPVSVKINANLTMSFTVTNPTVSTAHDATIQAPVLFTDFTIQSSTHTVVGNVISVGDVPPGSTIVSLVLRAPDQIGNVSDTMSLLFQEMTNPITQSISILVTEPPTITPILNLTLTYPASVKMNTNLTITFTITNPTTATAHGATIQAPILFTSFTIQSSTHPVVGNAISVGDVAPGTTIVAVELLAPNQAGTVSDTVNLLFQEMNSPVTQPVSILVKGGA